MKKILLSASLLAMSLLAQAQDDYKPVQGDVTAEFTYGGLFNPSQLGLNGGGLRFRYFLADQLAARVGFNASSNSVTNNFLYTENNMQVIGGTEKITTSAFDLNLGVEKHFTGTERLSTYAGADLRVNLGGYKEVGENTDGNNYDKGTFYSSRTGSTGIGLRLVAGADYYFVKKVYLGGEFGWGFLANSTGKTKTSVETGGSSVEIVTPASNNAKSFEVSPSVVGSVRLGFRF